MSHDRIMGYMPCLQVGILHMNILYIFALGKALHCQTGSSYEYYSQAKCVVQSIAIHTHVVARVKLSPIRCCQERESSSLYELMRVVPRVLPSREVSSSNLNLPLLYMPCNSEIFYHYMTASPKMIIHCTCITTLSLVLCSHGC